jgi:hypothetical protein
VCEGIFGRLFEVTPDGTVVWEYVSPYFGLGSESLAPAPGSPLGEVNYVFRAYRYGPDQVAQAGATAG